MKMVGLAIAVVLLMVFGAFMFQECYSYHRQLGASFWAALGACGD